MDALCRSPYRQRLSPPPLKNSGYFNGSLINGVTRLSTKVGKSGLLGRKYIYIFGANFAIGVCRCGLVERGRTGIVRVGEGSGRRWGKRHGKGRGVGGEGVGR
ncbi:hypothetical protein Ancab_012522 [Ancistrocladus abbreviatus]